MSALSHWLAYHLGNAELRTRLRELGTDCLDPEQAEMIDEVLAELDQAPEGERGELEMLVRETLEAIALG